jgi:tellurite resistance protein TerC
VSVSYDPLWWGGFLALIALLLSLDLFVFHRKAHEVRTREAVFFAAFWVLLALGFGAFVWLEQGYHKALEYYTGYVIELSLSVDNLFVIALVFTSFGVPRLYQHRVLFWGILGALVMRGAMIVGGATLVTHYHFIIYLFGAFLVFTGIRMLVAGDQEPDPKQNRVLKLFRKVVPSTDEFDHDHFVTAKHGRLLATPLLATLVVVETMDLVFAVDSIPAIFAVTVDPFIVFTSNIFAILGLRTFFFLLANIMDRFVHLKVGLAVILSFVGVKMLIGGWYVIPIYVSLAVILGVLLTSILTSAIATRAVERAARHRKDLLSGDGPEDKG